jgi:hypothetical protein
MTVLQGAKHHIQHLPQTLCWMLLLLLLLLLLLRRRQRRLLLLWRLRRRLVIRPAGLRRLQHLQHPLQQLLQRVSLCTVKLEGP